MTLESQQDEAAFEEEVLRVARALFARDRPFQGSTYLDQAERDGLFEGEDLVVVVEATVSHRLDKARKDGDKLLQACNALAKKHRFKGVKGYFVTRDEPEVDQRRYIEGLGGNIVACSISQFRSLLIDSKEYLECRDQYAFGSARNPDTGSAIELESYLEIGLSNSGFGDTAQDLNVSQLAARTAGGERTIILGDFGAGKSMTLREVHRRLATEHRSNRANSFPVTLNLRDHQGQKEPDEALRRHASRIGFDSPNKLVRAWRSGQVSLLLDGFDEIATTGWIGQANDLKTIRRRSVELIRKFVEESPAESGIVLTGRRHLFDSTEEMFSAFNLNRKTLTLATDQFTEDQVSDYLKQKGWAGALPTWLPSRPLLLGYLASSGAMAILAGAGENIGPAEGWNLLLDRICEREAMMEVGIDGATVRHILERLATVARARSDGSGPLLRDDLTAAFSHVCGYAPDEGSYMLLQRMPGLGALDVSDGSRHFIDDALADAARAGDVARYMQTSGTDVTLEQLRGVSVPLGSLGLGVAEVLAANLEVTGTQAAKMAGLLQKRGASSAFVLDAARISVALGGAQTWPNLFFENLILKELVFAEVEYDLSSMTFSNCLVDTLDLTEYDGDRDLPNFQSCAFGTVAGVGGSAALPDGHFRDCSFEQFDPSSKTTRGILASPGLTPRQRVALTILKKVYMQAGAGRKNSALIRGLTEQLKILVPESIDHLLASGLITRGRAGNNVLYYPVRGSGGRVRRMLESGATSDDVALKTA